MSAAQYTIHHLSPVATRLGVLDSWLSLDVALTVNAISTCVLTLPGSLAIDESWIDHRLEIVRTIPGTRPVLLGDTSFWIRKLRHARRGSRSTWELTGYSNLELLRRRVVAYPAASAETEQSNQADDMMATIVAQNLTTPTDATRTVADMATEPHLAAGRVTDKEGFAYRNVWDVIQEISRESDVAGSTPIYFDVIRLEGAALRFRIFPHQRGDDHGTGSSYPVVFSDERGNLVDPEVTWDYTNEVNFVYIGGAGEGTQQEIETASDAGRMALSAYNRREAYYDASQSTSLGALQDEGLAPLRAGRPKISFEASVLDTPAAAFGVHWNWGDRVIAESERRRYDCRLNQLSIHVSGNGQERITARLEAVV